MTTNALERPANVPADRVIDFDLYSFPVEGLEYQRSMRDIFLSHPGDVLWTPHNGGHWIVKTSELVGKVLSDNDHFSSRRIMVSAEDSDRPPLVPLQLDPPHHAAYRQLLQQALSPKAVGKLGERARELSIELIEGFKKDGHCEFIGQFAQHLPIAIFMEIVGLPAEDRPLLTDIAETAMRGETEEARNDAAGKLMAYGMAKVAERRANPGNDLISTIAKAEVDGKLIDDFTLTGLILLLLLGGLDTVASTLGFYAQFLATHPEHRRQLVEHPDLIANANEELLRRFPIAILAREVKADLVVDGMAFKAGDMVLVPTPMDGLDEDKFHEPLSVDFNREKPGANTTFGGGVHRCVGSMLARTELRMFLEEWLKRIPDFAIKPGTSPKVSARSVATITSLELVWAV
ncbi:cytochrome P450 [Novosphingobium sp. KCTC 2891]|uniref:cytochrome P450 n=1 Tax=Novosphingobium sp. KCTC 2891 TaxID=2989730 RepID=UPI002221F3E8|nr:cytochrome P450 [Novosphingobium sp. KCTC 2891]MCW1383651.1 cytochrome P450 [Novosphingobium sp. KCTC 2891]